MADPTFAFVVVESSAFSMLGRVHAAGVWMKQADVSAIEYQIFTTDSTTAHTAATSLVVTAVIYDALQTDGRWPTSTDTLGYNFRHDFAATVFTDPTKSYDVEYKFTMADASVVRFPRIRLDLEPLSSI